MVLTAISCNKSYSYISSAENLFKVPVDWVGQWEGDLIIASNSQERRNIPMELHILPLEDSTTYSFTILYFNDDKEDKREYLLKSIDPENGYYQIDEQNSIILDAYFIDGHLLQSFEVMGNRLTSDIYMDRKGLHYHITFGSCSSHRITGGGIVAGDTMPEVKSYPIRSTQRALLRLKKSNNRQHNQ